MLETVAALKIIILTTLSFALAMIWTPILVKILFKYKLGKSIRDEASAPIMSKLHAKKAGTPTMGGVLIWGTVLVLAAVFLFIHEVFPNSFLGSLNFITRSQTLLPFGAFIAAALLGLVDDYFNVRRIGPHGGGIRFRHRLWLYAAVAAVGAWWFYFKLDWQVLHIPFYGDVMLGWWYIPVFILIIVGTSFSVNQTDGLDGLAGGTLLTSFGAFAAIAFLQGRFDLAALCGAIIGALLAFLWWNINPAKFFMGDTGVMALGVTLGIVAMFVNQPLLLPIIGIVFVIEALSTIVQMLSKKIRKKKIFLSSPIHHHLEATGWGEGTIVMRFWVISIVAAGLGMIIALLDMAR
ncbi:MAG: phospho-N-acetylmuramoyl-pentapeptide-transferase [Patescibacteria group bacterium]|mgnify:CR=1 FL=1